jgi:hypothetical protein
MDFSLEKLTIIASRLIDKRNRTEQRINSDIANKFVEICIKNNITPDEFFDTIGESKDDPIYHAVKEKLSNFRQPV